MGEEGEGSGVKGGGKWGFGTPCPPPHKLIRTRDDGSCYIGVWRRLRRDCIYAWPRQGFRFSHIQSMQVEEDSKQLLDI